MFVHKAGWEAVRRYHFAAMVGLWSDDARKQRALCFPATEYVQTPSTSTDATAVPSSHPHAHPPSAFLAGRYGGVQEDSKTYQELCRAGDVLGVLELLTNKAVEEKVLQRAFMKASTYGSDINNVPSGDNAKRGSGDAKGERNFKVNPQCIVDIYREMVIPLTKDVEILYLFQRTGYPCPPLDGIHDT